MKIRLIIASIFIAGMTFTSCDKYFEDEIASPNDPTAVSPDLLLTNIQVATFANFSGQLARQTQIFTQQVAGTSAGSQTVEIMNYVVTELTNENEWELVYTGVMMNARLIIDDFGAANPHYAGMAKVMMAMNIGTATDLWGDVPYSNALNGLNGDFEATYDAQSELLSTTSASSIFALLDDAIADLGQPAANNALVPSSDDLIFNGDVSMWIKTAHTLKARYYNRLSKKDPMGSATNALNSLTNGISSNAEDCLMVFGPNGNEQNQWYAYNQQRGDYIKMGEFFVDMLNTNSDPRLPFYAALAPNGTYVGTPKDDVDSIATSNLGTYLNSLTSRIPLVGYVEAKFIEAEAEMRGGSPGNAATAHNDAVIASVTDVTGAAPDAAFIAAYASEDAVTITMEKIMTQKYIAMFGQLEAYNDYRRTDFPALTPNPAASLSMIPQRLIIPQQERLYNSNAVIVGDLTQSVWWDE